jgi:hypothetical protein
MIISVVRLPFVSLLVSSTEFWQLVLDKEYTRKVFALAEQGMIQSGWSKSSLHSLRLVAGHGP